MHTIRNILFLSVLVMIFASSCKKGEERADKPVWSSTDPFTIPTKNRIQKYLRGNLTENPSFEQGKQFPIDTSSHFYVDGWQKVGDRVQWTDITKDSIYAGNEASHKNRAIKIHREIAHETENKGEGILSNYIKVIPGNYIFTFDLKLQNIQPYSKRLGTKLYDAIDIRVQFYDKNKNPISGKLYSPALKKYIDYSIKNYPFSNYWEIQEMDWARIRGRSFEPLVMEGIIPNEAQYVRLHFGLKGTGTMWVDNVDFRYAATNLSLLEQMQIYKDSVPSPYKLLIPKPKHITPTDTIDYQGEYYKRPNDLIILIPARNHELEKKVAEEIQAQLTVLHDSLPTVPEVRIQTFLSPDKMNEHPMVISLGPTNLYQRYKELLPADSIYHHEQGYFIYTMPDLKHIIFAGSQTKQGIVYAGNTLRQLIDNQNKVIYNANIIDYPSFRKRGIVISRIQQEQYKTVLNRLDFLGQYNFNHVIFDQEKEILTSGATQELFIQEYNRSPLDQYYSSAILMNPFLESQLIDPYDTSYQCFNLTEKPGHINQIVNKYGNIKTDHYYIDFGENSIDLLNECINDNIAQWDVTKAIQTHESLIHELHQKFNSISPGADLSFIPTGLQEHIYFSDEGGLSIYYNKIFGAINEHSGFIWGGKNTRSPVIDFANYYRFSEYTDHYPHIIYNDIQSEALFLNDKKNTNRFLVGNKRLYSLFSPCRLNYLPPRNSDGHIHEISFGLDILSPIDMVRYLSYADYAWNREQYDPTASIWRILNALYGPENASELVQFNDAFVTLLEIINTPQYKSPVSKMNKTANAVINNLETHYQKLSHDNSMNADLLAELKYKMEQVIGMYKNKMERLEMSKTNTGLDVIN